MYQHIIERGIVAAIRCRDTKLRVKNTFAFSYFALPLVLNSSLNKSFTSGIENKFIPKKIYLSSFSL